MSTIADKLTSIIDTKTLIKEAITRKGGVVTENMPFSGYPSAIDAIPSVPMDVPHTTWQPNSSWWDIEQILKDDVNETYPNKYILLISDATATSALTKGVAYKTSDGAYYTGNVTHIWDTTKDKECNEGYKTRWVIVYISSSTLSISDATRLEVYPTLGVVFNCNVTDGTSGGYSNLYTHSYFIKILEPYRALRTTLNYTSEGLLFTRGILYNSTLQLRYTGANYGQISTMSGCTLEIPTSFKTITTHSSVVYPINILSSSLILKEASYSFSYSGGSSRPFLSLYSGSSRLTNLIIPQGYYWSSIDLRNCRLLPISNYRGIMGNIQDNTGGSTKYFYVNQYIYEYFTTSDKLLLASKNWTLSVITI